MTDVGLELTDGVAIVSLRAPQRCNSINPGLARDLIEVCDQVDNDPTIGAAVLRADGKHFCSGGDHDWIDAIAANPVGPAWDEFTVVYRCFRRLGTLSVPTIAAARGSTVGAGINLLLACDVRIVAADARIQSTFLQIGLHPGGGHYTWLRQAAGRQAAAALGLLGEPIDGTRAVTLGLAWEAPPTEQVETRALTLATRIATDPTLARLATQSFRTQLDTHGMNQTTAADIERAPQMWSLHRKLTHTNHT